MYIGIRGNVVCLHKETGQILWKTFLKNGNLTNITVEGDRLLAYSGGHLFSLDSATGSVLWENELSGLGYGPCIIATTTDTQGTVAAAQAQAQAQQASAAAAAAAVAATAASAGANSAH